MRAKSFALLAAATVAATLLPQPGFTGGGTHEVGHWMGLYHTFNSGGRPIVIGMIANGDDSVPAQPTHGAFLIGGETHPIGLLACLEFEVTRTGQEVAYASFGPIGAQTQQTDFAFIQFHLEDGVSTEADVGYSELRTSGDRCGAAATRVTKIDALVFKTRPID